LNTNFSDLGTGSRAHPISTLGGGTGVTVIYGVAAPVKTPLMGPVRAN
jgi:hypothetical protein